VRYALQLEAANVAQAVNISADDLAAYEADKKEPEPQVLWDLAHELGVELGFFLRTLPITPVRYANPPTSSAREQDVVTAQTRIWFERYFDIESFFPIEDTLLFEPPEGFPLTVTSGKDSAEAGEALREAWGLGTQPIASMATLLEANGIKVGLIEGFPGFEAAAYWSADDFPSPAIVANGNIPVQVQRFAIAQELAYLMLEGATPQTAPHFAAALLMPADAMRRELGSKRTAIELYELDLLKVKYGIGMRHLLARAASLRILDKETFQTWSERFTEEDWLTKEPGDVVPDDSPDRQVHLLLRLQSEGEITVERAAELIGTTEDVWQEILEGAASRSEG
jgi:Zn-dependent peptidase ImmA (M78 family)